MKTTKQSTSRKFQSISFRFTPDALRKLKKAAKEDGRSLNNFMQYKVAPNAHLLVGDQSNLAA